MKIAPGKKEEKGVVASAHGAELGGHQTGRAAALCQTLSNGTGSSSGSRRAVDEDKCCRICYDDCNKQDMIAPCVCSGSMKWVHRTCLDEWRASSTQELAFSQCCNCESGYQLVKHDEPFPELECRKTLRRIRVASRFMAVVVNLIFATAAKILFYDESDLYLQIRVMFLLGLTTMVNRKLTQYFVAFVDNMNIPMMAKKETMSFGVKKYAVKDLTLEEPQRNH